MRKRTWLLLIGLALVLAACAPGSDNFAADDRANFFHGIWHGWIAPFTLVWEIFDSDIRVYEGSTLRLEEDIEPEYETDEPNGPGCGVRRSATVSLSLQ